MHNRHNVDILIKCSKVEINFLKFSFKHSNSLKKQFLLLFHLDDTYIYDDSIASSNCSEMQRNHQQHWYDEPPYESDPDDFMGVAATIQVNVVIKS